MNTMTLDSMAFDNFEVAEITSLSSIEAGSYSWSGFGDAVAEGAWTGAVGGAIGGAAGGAVTVPLVGSVPGVVGGAFYGAIGGGIASGSWYLISGGD